MAENVIRSFNNYEAARQAILGLLEIPISPERISIVSSNGHDEIRNPQNPDKVFFQGNGDVSGTTAGEFVGATLGSAIGLIVGIASLVFVPPLAGMFNVIIILAIAGIFSVSGFYLGKSAGKPADAPLLDERLNKLLEKIGDDETVISILISEDEKGRVVDLLDRDGLVEH